MKALGLRPVQFTFTILAAAAVAVALLLMSSGSTEASHGATTESSANYSYAATPSSFVPGADRGLVTVFSVPFPANINFGNLMQFYPDSAITQTCNTAPGWVEGDVSTTHTAGGACLKSGDLVGTLSSATQIGTINNPCENSGSITIVFDLFAVPTPNNVANPRASTNIAYTQPEGWGSRFGEWGWESDKALPADDFVPGVVGTGNVTYQAPELIQAEGTNTMFHGYPEYLLDLFSTAGDGGTSMAPLAVYGGLTKVSGTPVPLYFVIFEPGALAAEFAAPNPLSRATTDLGYASQTVLNDPTPPAGNASSVTAFCSTTSTATLSATVGGVSRAKNPDDPRCTTVVPPLTAAGCTALDLAWAATQRDLDNDGIENGIDTCPAAVDLDGDARTFNAGLTDPDGDNIDGACDPDGIGDTTVNAGDDVDSDTWLNQADNCELVSNAGQISSEVALGVDPGYVDGRSNDGGPLGDSIGDACDDEIGALAVTYNTLAHVITPSDTIANGRWQAKGMVVANCYGGTDGDVDGYCASDADAGFDGVAGQHGSWTLTPALSAVLGTTSGANAGSFDTDGANGASSGYDSDWLETYVGTDARQPCSLSATGLDPTLPDEPLSAWVYDYNTDQKADFGDILPIASVFNKPATFVGPGPTFIKGFRFDWNADGWVDFGDILTIAPAFNEFCTPIVGPQ